jgi:hypothetical protein
MPTVNNPNPVLCVILKLFFTEVVDFHSTSTVYECWGYIIVKFDSVSLTKVNIRQLNHVDLPQNTLFFNF